MPDTSDYRRELAERFSNVDNVLVHRLVACLDGELRRRDPNLPLHILNSPAYFRPSMSCQSIGVTQTVRAQPRSNLLVVRAMAPGNLTLLNSLREH